MKKSLKSFLKKTWLYSYYEHMQRKKVLKNINKLRKTTLEEQKKLISERYENGLGNFFIESIC